MNNSYLDTNIKASCCGCKVCASVCPKGIISFSLDDEGFWYPKIDEEKCIHCNKCRKVCPLTKEPLHILKDENQTYAAYMKSDEVLKNSASGGMFTAFSDVILNKGGTVFGHVYDEGCRVICAQANNESERNRMRGSKYVQSDMHNIYENIKSACTKGKNVLFTGTPCQIDAVKHYFNNILPENLYTVGLICHGVPSPKIFSEYVAIEEKKVGKKIKDIVFRDKENGWKMPLVRHCYTDGSNAAKLLNADAFNNLFLGTDCILRPSCYECKYAGKQRFDDISIGDFWGIQNKHTDMFNNDKGVSVILVNNEKGKELFLKAMPALIYKQVALADAQERNLPLNEPCKPFVLRERVFKEYNKYGAKYILYKYMFRKKFLSSFPIRALRKIYRIVKGVLQK